MSRGKLFGALEVSKITQKEPVRSTGEGRLARRGERAAREGGLANRSTPTRRSCRASRRRMEMRKKIEAPPKTEGDTRSEMGGSQRETEVKTKSA